MSKSKKAVKKTPVKGRKIESSKRKKEREESYGSCLSGLNQPPLMIKDFSILGNTYEITIEPWDHIIVTVQHPDTKSVVTYTKISPIGISIGPEEDFFMNGTGKRILMSDFSVRPLTDYKPVKKK